MIAVARFLIAVALTTSLEGNKRGTGVKYQMSLRFQRCSSRGDTSLIQVMLRPIVTLKHANYGIMSA